MPILRHGIVLTKTVHVEGFWLHHTPRKVEALAHKPLAKEERSQDLGRNNFARFVGGARKQVEGKGPSQLILFEKHVPECCVPNLQRGWRPIVHIHVIRVPALRHA